ncbi:GNAT family N-acetyltransferase [soil metagenome]
MQVRRLASVEEIGAKAWRALEPPDFPFFDYEFVRGLERSGSVGPGTGWSPLYLVCENEGEVLGALCLYVKTDSYGEYIFDWEWAYAYEEHGLPYYPKLVAAVPFTPATGPKLLSLRDLDVARQTEVRSALLAAAAEMGAELRISSIHALFLPDEELGDFEQRGFAIRHSLQFHWHNREYAAFSDYLEALAGKRRRQICRERRQLRDAGVEIERVTGPDLTPEHAAIMYRFYINTSDGKWGMPYLTEGFFEHVFRTMADRTLLVLARDSLTQRPVAGALNFFKGRSLFGRYWGTAETRRNLHFELCYYQAIEFAIERELELFEAGAQGEHKLARGFLPTLTYSAHEIRHPAFRRVINQYIDEEKKYLAATIDMYGRHDPYKN